MELIKILKKEKFILLLIAAVCSFFFFYKLGSYKLIDVDEPRYAEAAREMLASGNWLTPYFNYELRFDKPIFFYWLIALSYLIFGITEFAARFPSAVLATATVFFTYYFGRTTISKSFGLISALILASSLEFIAIGRMSITDMTLSFFIVASIYSGFLASFTENKNKKYWWWLFYFFSGLAVLTKGPVGLVLPVAVVGFYLIFTGKVKESLKPVFTLPGALIFSATVIPWYYLIIQEHGKLFIDYFFIRHNLERFASSGFGQHHQPFYFYFIVILAGFFPWTIFFISSLIKYLPKLFKSFWEKKSRLLKLDFALFKEADNRLKVILFSVIWFLVIFIFFSSSKAKLLTYILSLFPAIALLTGNLWHEFINNNENNKSIKISARIFAGICLIAALFLIFEFNLILPKEVKLDFNYINYALILILLVFPALLLVFLSKNRKIEAFASYILLMIGITLVALFSILPIVYNSGQKDLIDYVKFAQNVELSDKKLLTYGLVKPSVVFYSQKKVPYISDNDYSELSKNLNSKNSLFIIVRNSNLSDISGKIKFYLVKKGKKYSLISNQNLKIE